MGLADLEMRNISLLLRWWWKGYKELPNPCNVPPTVRIFVYLLIKDKILIREVMIRRSFNCQTAGCALCGSCHLESALHLFFQCPSSVDIWNRVNNVMGYDLLVQGNSVQEIWRRSFNRFKHNPVTRSRWQGIFSDILLVYLEATEHQQMDYQ